LGERADPNHAQALRVLAASGKLDAMIGRVEAQLRQSPESLTLHQTLADYYQAAGRRDEVREVYERMGRLRPDDARLRFQVAGLLLQSGETAAALDHYRAALKAEPALFGARYSEVYNAFTRANKTDELARLLEEIDL